MHRNVKLWWTNGRVDNNTNKHQWIEVKSAEFISMPKCRLFLPSNLSTISKPMPRTVGWTGERMKWKQYTSASMSAEGKSSGYISMPSFMPFLPSDLSANAQKPENVVNERTDGQTDGRTEGQTSGQEVILCPPQLGRGQKCGQKRKLKNVKKNQFLWCCDIDLWPTTLKS